MKKKSDICVGRFISEIDVISEKCANMAKEYLMLKGQFQSLILMKELANEDNLKRSTIRFINSTNSLRVTRIISLVWMLSDPLKKPSDSPLTSVIWDSKGRNIDKAAIKFAGDLTLHRMLYMYDTGVNLFPDILASRLRISLDRANCEGKSDETLLRSSDLRKPIFSKIAERAKEHFDDKDVWHKIDVIRNQFVSHSTIISDKHIAYGFSGPEVEIVYDEVFKFGDRAAKLALDFNDAWRKGWTDSPDIENIINTEKRKYEEFWRNLFNSATI